jgi:hypothetical protein
MISNNFTLQVTLNMICNVIGSEMNSLCVVNWPWPVIVFAVVVAVIFIRSFLNPRFVKAWKFKVWTQ